MSDVNAKAAEMFAAGESVNAVAKALGISYYMAKKAYDAHQAGARSEAAPAKRGGGRTKAAVAELPDADDAPEAWDLGVNVATDKLDTVIATFSPEEKAAGIKTVLQMRMDALIA